MDELLESYKAGICFFCKLLAQLNIYLFYKKEVDDSVIQRESKVIRQMKVVIGKLKEDLGFTDGFDFMENTKFRGFELKDGRILGDVANLEKFVTPWILEFPENGINNHMYEVGVYLLSQKMAIDEFRKEETDGKEESNAYTA